MVRFRKYIMIEMYIKILLIVTSTVMTHEQSPRATYMCVLLGDGEEQTRFRC